MESIVGYSLWFLSLKLYVVCAISEKRIYWFVAICLSFAWSVTWCSFTGLWDVVRMCDPDSRCRLIWYTQKYWSVRMDKLPRHGMSHDQSRSRRSLVTSQGRDVFTIVTHLCTYLQTGCNTSWSIPRLHAISVRIVFNCLSQRNIRYIPCCSNIIVKGKQTGIDVISVGGFAKADQSYSLMEAVFT